MADHPSGLSCSQCGRTDRLVLVVAGEHRSELCFGCLIDRSSGRRRQAASVLSALYGSGAAPAFESPQDLPGDLSCAGCGATYAEVVESGMLGCANCYTTFEAALLPILERLHALR